MPALLGNVTTDVLLKHVVTQYNSLQELYANLVNSASDLLLSTQLSNLPSVVLPNVDQYVVHRLDIDAFDIEDLVIPSLVVLVAIVSLLFSLLLDYWSLRSRGTRTASDSQCSEPLHALMSIITPAYSQWPPYYLSAVNRGLLRREARLELPLSQLLTDVLSGAIELRSPDTDLPDLIAGTLQSQGWRVSLTVESGWHVDLTMRLAKARLARMIPQVGRCEPLLFITRIECRFDTQRRIKLRECSAVVGCYEELEESLTGVPVAAALGPENLSKVHFTFEKESQALENEGFLRAGGASPSRSTVGHNVLMLDAVPFAQLPAYIRAFQASLAPGMSAMLGFSTLGSSVQADSTQFLVASMPFLPRQYTHKPGSCDELPQSARRTLIPLLTSLNQVLELVSSGPSPLLVESVQNVSDQYAGFLQDYTRDLTYLSSARDKFVSRWGVAGWREERLLGSWEAALFSTTILSRWLILVRK